MSFNKKFFTTGGIVAASGVCKTDSHDIFTGGVALYNLDYDASDASGNYDGTPSNVTFGVGGQINYGARFNGSSSYIDTGVGGSVLGTLFSVSVWFKTSTTSTYQTILDNGGNTSDHEGFALVVGSDNILKARFGDGHGNALYDVSTSITVADGIWHHCVLTYNNESIKIYVDNGTPATGTNTATPSSSPTFTQADYNLRIGAYVLNGLAFNGDIDQVRIFSSELTSTQVSTLYAEEACVYTATANTADFPSTATAVAHYPLDNSSEDNHGNTYDGTETNIEYRFGRYGQAAVFNGSSSKIDTGLALNTSNAFSYSLWLNTNSYSTGAINMMIDTTSTTNPFPGCGIGHANGQIAGFIAGTTGHLTYNGGFLTLNQWHHTVLTHDGSGNFKLYVDGVETGTGSHSSNLNSGQNILIGNSAVSTWNGHNGKIDQVRIFSTALDSDQVSELYNEKPETDTSNFKTVLYEGNGDTTNPTYISNVGIDLETNGGLVWVKSRTTTYNHLLMDSVRGTTSLTSNDTTAERTNYNRFQSYEANGFMILANNAADLYKINRVGHDFVAWVWKGGGDNVLNEDGDNIDSQVSANVDAGFSIVKWTGDGNSLSSVGHGLTVNNENMLVFIKDLDASNDWMVITNNMWSTPTTSYLKLNTTQAVTTGSGTPYLVNNTTFKNAYRNTSGNEHIAYCFHSVSGYSKIGTYTGSGTTKRIYTDSNNDGTGTGAFKPSWIIIKNITNAYGWGIVDNRRLDSSGIVRTLFANDETLTESSISSGNFVFNDDGFTIQGYGAGWANLSSSNTYLYMAFK